MIAADVDNIDVWVASPVAVQALVDSVEEKERLLRRSQQNLTEDAKAQIAEVESLQAENRRLRQQLDERSGMLTDKR